MYLVSAILFAILASIIAFVAASSKIFVVATNPIAAAIAFVSCLVAATAFFVRHGQSQRQSSRADRSGDSMFWTWVSRAASVVALLSGLLSFGRQIFEMIGGV
jgi:hypothetical protein